MLNPTGAIEEKDAEEHWGLSPLFSSGEPFSTTGFGLA
jgi:hypothetical protein